MGILWLQPKPARWRTRMCRHIVGTYTATASDEGRLHLQPPRANKRNNFYEWAGNSHWLIGTNTTDAFYLPSSHASIFSRSEKNWAFSRRTLRENKKINKSKRALCSNKLLFYNKASTFCAVLMVNYLPRRIFKNAGGVNIQPTPVQ